MPDFGKLSQRAAGGAAGKATGGRGGGSGHAGALGGSTDQGGEAENGGAAVGPQGGGAGDPLGEPGGGESGGGDSAGGSGGSNSIAGADGAGRGGSEACAWNPGSTFYTGFDNGDMAGPGVLLPRSEFYLSTVNGATASVAVVSTEGASCPGAFELTANFKGYSTTVPESISGMVNLQAANLTGALLLHASVKVVGPTTELQGIQVFIKSRGYTFYRTTFDSSLFRDGQWHDEIVSLSPLDSGTEGFDPTDVRQFGVQALLFPAAPSAELAVPATITVYLDNVWVEF